MEFTDNDQSLCFPNGFESWQETHFEMAYAVQHAAMRRGSLSYQRYEIDGTGGLYELARALTDKFEAEHKGRVWDGEFFDALEVFFRLHNI